MKRIECLDKGFVELRDVMGNDQSIVDSARVSVSGDAVKAVSDDRTLIRYLMRHHHCYHPTMEVFTARGWIKWSDCLEEETFMVPNPVDHTLSPEKLPLIKFKVIDETMEDYFNSRMSYRVTSNHKMWFKKKNEPEYRLFNADEMPRWGHFESGAAFHTKATDDTEFWHGQLLGFSLGDGGGTGYGLSFHLKKDRKKEYLRNVLHKLNIAYTENKSATHDEATVFYLGAEIIKEWIQPFYNPQCRAENKQLLNIPELTGSFAHGILDGLINSDGHTNSSRKDRVEFSSKSEALVKLFCDLATVSNYDAHFDKPQGGTFRAKAVLSEGRTSLEARKQYFSTSKYTGSVYCTTTSTGLLLVRGGPNEFSFICGNSTPFENVVFTFAVKAPILVVRQWQRHRASSFNEMSARYSIMPDEFYIPDLERMNVQAKNNHQGSDAGVIDQASYSQALIKKSSEVAYANYQELVNNGLARELARSVLPVNIYSTMYYTVNLHNLMHFLHLRLDSHAQGEIRVFAQAILDLVREHVPMAIEAFEDYRQNSVSFSSMEWGILKRIVWDAVRHHEDKGDDSYAELGLTNTQLRDQLGSKREVSEFLSKIEMEPDTDE